MMFAFMASGLHDRPLLPRKQTMAYLWHMLLIVPIQPIRFSMVVVMHSTCCDFIHCAGRPSLPYSLPCISLPTRPRLSHHMLVVHIYINLSM